MRFASRVFLGESIKGDPSKIIRKLKKHKLVLGTYLICPAENGIDPLEYYDTAQLNQAFYKNKELDIKVRGRSYRGREGDIRGIC